MDYYQQRMEMDRKLRYEADAKLNASRIETVSSAMRMQYAVNVLQMDNKRENKK